MTVEALAAALKLETVICPEPEREISGVYIGDLLSWVMGRATAGCIWITIMSNVNVCAVASLADVAVVLLAEGVIPDPPALEAARTRGINILSSSLTAYRLASELASLGL